MAAEPQLTPACELAFAVARDGAEATPAVEAPAAMRSFLGAEPLPRRALTVAQRTIDTDPAFRQRVAERADEAQVGRAAWLWLHRPEGWEGELTALIGRLPGAAPLAPAEPELPAAVPSDDAGEAPAGTDLEQELEGLRSMVERLIAASGAHRPAVGQLEADLAAACEERDRLRADLGVALAERDQASGRAGELELALRQQAERAGSHHADVAQLVAELERARHERDTLLGELERGRARLEQARQAFAEATAAAAAELDRAVAAALAPTTDAAGALSAAVEQACQQAHQLEVVDRGVGAELPLHSTEVATPGDASHVLPPGGHDAAELPAGGEEPHDGPADGEHLLAGSGSGSADDDPGVAGGGADDDLLDDDDGFDLLGALAPYLGEDGTGPTGRGGAVDGGPDVALGTAGAGAPWEDPGASEVEPPREPWGTPVAELAARQALHIPAELLDEPLAAARHVTAVAEVVLLVEGDAVATLGWPTLPVPEQRHALVSYLGDLAGSTGAAADVVFDGGLGEPGDLPVSDLVRVRATAPGVAVPTAVAALVDAYPVDWPVVVVTDDPALELEAGQRGAAALPGVALLDLFIAQ